MIVSFYSFKGGVGRTLALAHAAWLLAAGSPEQQILAIDLDLEAPGLDSYFEFPGWKECKGLAGLIQNYQQQPEIERREWLRRMLSDESHGYVVRPQGENERTNLWYLPSGLGRGRSVSYRRVTGWLRKEIELQDRSQGWPAAANRGFLGDFRAVLAEGFAYALIDSRTGLADEAFASTVLLAHALVVCFRLSDIHLQGIRSAVANFAKREGLRVDHPALPLIPVVTPLPTRGGQDIHRWLEEKVLPLFQRWQPPDEDLDTWERSPLLALDTPIVRLYEEPFLEIGQPMLVDKLGELLQGFDDGVPLVAGYDSLVNSIRLLGYLHDLEAAAGLEEHYLPERPTLALRYWRIQAGASLDTFSTLSDNYDSEDIGPEAVRVAVEVLESWERRLADDDTDGRDKLAYAWRSVANLAAKYDREAVKRLGERAVEQAHSQAAKGVTRWCLAADLRRRIPQDAAGKVPSPRFRKDSDDPGVRIIELLETAERELRAASEWSSLFGCLQSQIDIYQETRRYRKAVEALGKAAELVAMDELAEQAKVARTRVTTLCLLLGQVSAAIRAGAQQEPWIHSLGIVYLFQLRWRNLARDIATKARAVIDKDLLSLAFLTELDATGAGEGHRPSQELSLPARLYLEFIAQILRGQPEPNALSMDDALDDYPYLVLFYDIWARLFHQHRDLSDAEVLVQIHRYNLDTSLIGIRAWLTAEPGQATRMLRRQLNQAGPMDARARALIFYGLHAAFLGNAAISRRCGQLLTQFNEYAPEVNVVVRNSDFWILADAVLAQLIREKRIDPERITLFSELVTIITAPPDPPEPETLAWSWEDGLPLESMHRAAEFLERLPDDIDEILAMPLLSS